MDVLTADELSSVLDHLSLKSICRIAAVCRQLHAASKAKVVDMSALESFCAIERAQEGPLRSALRASGRCRVLAPRLRPRRRTAAATAR